MKRFGLSMALVVLCSMGFYILPSGAYAVPIDLNGFYLEGDGGIASDGSSATLEVQDPLYGYTLLVNDPLYGDPGISVGGDALALSFGFEFFEEAGNDTELYVRLLDGENGDLIADFLLVGDGTLTGTHTFDLTTLLTGQTLLGLDFTITEYGEGNSGGYNLDSWAVISDLDLSIQEPVPVPEPGTLMLLGTGLIALGGMRRKHRR